jgi:hypothetical protein
VAANTCEFLIKFVRFRTPQKESDCVDSNNGGSRPKEQTTSGRYLKPSKNTQQPNVLARLVQHA